MRKREGCCTCEYWRGHVDGTQAYTSQQHAVCSKKSGELTTTYTAYCHKCKRYEPK